MIYEHKKKFYSKTYTLKEETIVLEQQAKFELDYKVEFNLKSLNLPHGTSRTFINEFNYPIVILGIIIFLCAFIFSNGYKDYEKYLMIGMMIVGVMTIASSGLFRKKTNNAIYYNVDNTYIFEVSQLDKSVEEFEGFISELNNRIAKSKKMDSKADS